MIADWVAFTCSAENLIGAKAFRAIYRFAGEKLTKPLPRDVILFSTADWDYPFWTNKQHTAMGLAERGFRVLYIDSLGLRRPTLRKRDLTRVIVRLGKSVAGLRQVHDRIWVNSPLVLPVHRYPRVRWFNGAILRKRIHLYARSLGFRDPIVWTYNPLVVELFGRLNASMWVYHCVDDLSAAPHMPTKAIVRAEEMLVRAADLVFTTSPCLQKTRSAWNPKNTHFLPNVADFDHFSQARRSGDVPADLSSIPRPRIGFIGAVSDYKVDLELIGQIAELRRDWHWVMIGPVGEGQPGTSLEILQRPNIHHLGPKAYLSLPDYLRGFDVAVLPCRSNAYTRAMFPMKFFEYLAAGKPVVATDIPALHAYSNACIITKTPDDFMRAIAEMLDGKVPDPKRCLELAQQYTWEWRLKQMEELMLARWRQKPGV